MKWTLAFIGFVWVIAHVANAQSLVCMADLTRERLSGRTGCLVRWGGGLAASGVAQSLESRVARARREQHAYPAECGMNPRSNHGGRPGDSVNPDASASHLLDQLVIPQATEPFADHSLDARSESPYGTPMTKAGRTFWVTPKSTCHTSPRSDMVCLLLLLLIQGPERRRRQ